jgi:hypothetical protein
LDPSSKAKIVKLFKTLGKEAVTNLEGYVGEGRRTFSNWDDMRDLPKIRTSSVFFNDKVDWTWIGSTTNINPAGVKEIGRAMKPKVRAGVVYYFLGPGSYKQKELFLSSYTGYFAVGGLGFGPASMNVLIGNMILDNNLPNFQNEE